MKWGSVKVTHKHYLGTCAVGGFFQLPQFADKEFTSDQAEELKACPKKTDTKEHDYCLKTTLILQMSLWFMQTLSQKPL